MNVSRDVLLVAIVAALVATAPAVRTFASSSTFAPSHPTHPGRTIAPPHPGTLAPASSTLAPASSTFAPSHPTHPGRTIAPPHPRTLAPARVVSLVPAVTEMLFAIGAGDAIVGVSSFDRFPPEVASRPRVGALVDPDFERILSLRPDLVVVYGSQTDLMGRLDRAGIPAFRYEHAGLADITATIRALGARMDRVDRAEAVARQIERDLEDVRRRVAGRPRVRTAVIVARETGTLRGIYASGGIGFLHDMLEVAGGEDVFADVKRQNLQATAELLLSRSPHVIVEIRADPGWTPERIARARDVWRALPALPAVQRGRVHVIADERLAVPGPRVADAVRVLADALHGSGR